MGSVRVSLPDAINAAVKRFSALPPGGRTAEGIRMTLAEIRDWMLTRPWSVDYVNRLAEAVLRDSKALPSLADVQRIAESVAEVLDTSCRRCDGDGTRDAVVEIIHLQGKFGAFKKAVRIKEQAVSDAWEATEATEGRSSHGGGELRHRIAVIVKTARAERAHKAAEAAGIAALLQPDGEGSWDLVPIDRKDQPKLRPFLLESQSAIVVTRVFCACVLGQAKRIAGAKS